MNDQRKKILLEYKNKTIEGISITLVPFNMNFAKEVVDLRNSERAHYYLSQNYTLSIESQTKWYEDYQNCENDLYWCILNKKKHFIGTIRVYKIDFENNTCEQGSFILDEQESKLGPYAIEAELLSIRFCFDVLKMTTIKNCNRHDNKNMNSISRKLGFINIGSTLLREIEYHQYELFPNNFKEEKLQKTLENWKKMYDSE